MLLHRQLFQNFSGFGISTYLDKLGSYKPLHLKHLLPSVHLQLPLEIFTLNEFHGDTSVQGKSGVHEISICINFVFGLLCF